LWSTRGDVDGGRDGGGLGEDVHKDLYLSLGDLGSEGVEEGPCLNVFGDETQVQEGVESKSLLWGTPVLVHLSAGL